MTKYFMSRAHADHVYDEQLINSADSVIGRLRLKGGAIDVDLPASVISILRHNFKDKFYFQIISPGGKLIDGDADLPRPKVLPSSDEPIFAYDYVNGQQVRTAIQRAVVQEAPANLVFVLVAETIDSRKALASEMLVEMILTQLLFIIVGSAAVFFGISRGLSRLKLLEQELSSRSAEDLAPLSEDNAPVEVRPLVRAINELIQSLREDLESKQRFISNAAHQLRTPVAGLKTYVGLLKKQKTDENTAELIDQLDLGADHTTHLVNRLLSLAKSERSGQLKFCLIDLNKLAAQAALSLAPEAAKKDIELSLEAEENIAFIMGDTVSILELITNILENAILYTPAHGAVRVLVESGETVRLSVEDTGPGIPQAEQEHVFERFYRVLGTGTSGSGLGLSIVKEIARSHNAIVQLGTGAGGIGTKVTVDFVRAANEELLSDKI